MPNIGIDETVQPGVTAVEILQEATDPDAQQLVGFRRLGGGPLDIPPYTHDQMQRLALALYRRNPYAHRIVKLVAAFAASGAVKFEAEDQRVQEILTEHWNHPLNNWESNFYQCILELGLYGEVFLRSNVTKLGDVTWGQVDPLRVRTIKPDTRDLSRPAIAAVVKSTAMQESMGDIQELPIITYDGRARSNTKGYRVGDILFAKTNGVRGALRGLSDLFPLADYLDGIDQFMFALQQRVSQQNNWIWDVKLEGASENDIKQWLSGVHGKAPKPGAIRAHNERVEWQALTPSFGASEAGEHVTIAKNYVLAGAGLADWILGDMSSANRAATESSASVIAKTMEQRQREAKVFLEDIFNFVIDQKILVGALPKAKAGRGKKKLDRRFYITLPKIPIRDYQRVSNALRQGADGLKTLVETGLVEPDRAKRIADQLLSQLDLEGGDRFRERDPIGSTEDKGPNQRLQVVPIDKDKKTGSSGEGS